MVSLFSMWLKRGGTAYPVRTDKIWEDKPKTLQRDSREGVAHTNVFRLVKI